MELKNENEFEKNQPNSSEMTENTKAEEQAVDTINFSHTEENSHAVDATVTVETKDFVNHEEQEEPIEFDPTTEATLPLEMDQTRTTSQVDQKYKKKRNVRGFASTLAAGVIGSVLTLVILPHTDYIKNHFPKVENQGAISSQQGTSVKPVVAQPTAASSNSIADTVENVSKAIVGIVNYQQQENNLYGNPNTSQSVESGSGSGVIFQKNNDTAYIVTNNHVVEGASKLEVSLFDGEKATAEVVGTDALTDLAVLKIDAKYVTATADFGNSSTLRPGDQVYAIGNPLGLDLSRTVTQGIVSATNRSIAITTSAGNWDTNVIQTDAAINPGNSGGALINPQGQVIGINSLKISESGVEGLGFAIPSNDLIPIVNQLIKSGKMDRPYLGVGLADLDQVPQMYWQNMPNNTTKGVLLTNIEPNSAAAKAGLQVKDIIVSMNGTEITSSSDLRKYLYTKVSKGAEIKFGIYREGKQMTIIVKLSE
ncbi:trypsin-like peptidase domain-containing protein [Bacillus sp. ISL-40]|uniref:S1C family serine protease n=1 Tax=unclassified Bacillus (in: firmicutes) TaxID=185979 RepID=UPI001BE9C876|nr:MULTISPECIES: trypsin-like peptidase domain-containing protein [unclassified Bacillus (in: firmicutes)]MBT2699690.1 trypsin-like peptidase domain-containing protein [Bacillus sp. ISL-40]MBT2744310.1 trypsin-like peptidase domain-containing protein [Bacillus sp. ISL-77]